MDPTTALFYAFGSAALCCALGLLCARHPLHGALYLIGVMLSLSGLYVLLDSPFLGTLQVLVYAGAVMMLMVFVIMVLGRAKSSGRRVLDWLAIGGAVVPALLGALLVGQVGRPGALTVKVDRQYAVTPASASAAAISASVAAHIERTDRPALRGEVAPLAQAMFRTDRGHWLLFQLVGVLLLIAIVAAVLLAKRRLDTPDETPEVSHDHH